MTTFIPEVEVIRAAVAASTIDVESSTNMGCTVNLTGNVSIMKSPIGSPEFCDREVRKRVDAAAWVLEAIANLPDRHCAMYLLRFQVGRMDYTMRTTPHESCTPALRVFDASVRRAFDTINGKLTTDGQ